MVHLTGCSATSKGGSSMYGLINAAIQELVISTAGEDVWLKIAKAARAEPDGFEALCPYSDALSYTLVELAAHELNIPETEILKAFGRFWITYTAEEGYGDLMILFGADFRTCLRNLNRMHAHMGATMPMLKPPRFKLEERSTQKAVLHYFSTRSGLAPMVIGLLEGLAEKYKERIEVSVSPAGTRSDHDEFDIEFLPA